MIKDISRKAVDGYLKVVRLPVDTVLGDRESDRAKSLGVRVDKADAGARRLAGTALRNPDLKEDARKRRAAADERAHALRLHEVAGEHAEQAEEKAEEAEKRAVQRRQDAAKRAASEKRAAEKRKQATKKQADQRAAEQKRAAEKLEVEKKATAAKKAKREKLAELKSKEEALEKRETAVTAKAESTRLKNAAARAKAERKNGS